jgi:predicted transcriptional regulator
MENRDRNDIIALILQACTEPSTATRIMYSTLLNFRQVKYYARYLVGIELLEHRSLEHKYAITNKGRRYLELYNSGLELMNDIGIIDNN